MGRLKDPLTINRECACDPMLLRLHSSLVFGKYSNLLVLRVNGSSCSECILQMFDCKEPAIGLFRCRIKVTGPTS